MNTTCFALLDDMRSAGARSRLYQALDRHLYCEDIAALPAFLAEVEACLQQGLYCVFLGSYELGEALHAIPVNNNTSYLAEALIFTSCQHLSTEEVNHWLASQSTQPASVFNLTSSVDESAFTNCIHRIQDYIRAGDTYQVNYTFRLLFNTAGSPLNLYSQLRLRQPVPYGAYIQLPDDRVILSLSPELFITHQQQEFTARPMKGTAKAVSDPVQNQQIQHQLQEDTKNRAENVMIVDLLRNDLGSIATAGSVKVPDLFTVTQFGQVWQMTSTVTATAKPDLSLPQLIEAIYPCGSITGAPKHRTMQIIRELETTPRQLYTGAIGWFDPLSGTQDQTLPDFCLSVPIRTLLLSSEKNGIRSGQMGIGAGIVYDSEAQSEYQECLLKGQFLSEIAMDIGLIETMQVTRESGYRHLTRHLNRLQYSSLCLNIPLDMSALEQLLIRHQVTLSPKVTYRARVVLTHTGQFDISSTPFEISKTPVTVFLAKTVIHPTPLLAHKTTDRAIYNATLEKVFAKKGFDALFFNDKNELTEGCRSNVFARVNGAWYTPPVSSGALPGIMRQIILEDDNWQASERVITRDELLASTQIMVCNDLHGPLFVHLDKTLV